METIVTRADLYGGDILVIELRSRTGEALPSFEPGAHIDVYLENGIVRQYSLWGDPAQSDRYRIAVKRVLDSRGGSTCVHQTIRGGSKLRIGQQRNNFSLVDTPGYALLWGGGIGITPLLSMARHLAARGRPFSLHFFCRPGHQDAFCAELESLPPDSWHLHIGVARQDVPGMLGRALLGIGTDAHFYTCGPQGFMDESLRIAASCLDSERIHLERFSASGDPTDTDMDPGGFQVVLARRGETVTVGPEQTILEVLEARGIGCDAVCREGLCGTCVTQVIGGVPEHRDYVLSKKEKAKGNVICICVSRSTGPMLTLDL